MSGIDRQKPNPWGQKVKDPEFIRLDTERILKETIKSIEEEVRRAAKELDVTFERDRNEHGVSFRVLTGDVDVLRARVANIVGRTNDDLKQQGSGVQLNYGTIDDGARVIFPK